MENILIREPKEVNSRRRGGSTALAKENVVRCIEARSHNIVKINTQEEVGDE